MSDRKRAVDILDSLVCSHVGKKDMINELLDNIIELVKEEVPRWTFAAELRPDEPELIQGYTAEQWQEIIDGGYLCEFSGDGNSSHGMLEIVKEGNYPFHKSEGSDWSYCRPAQIKGVMRPIFVEPVDKAAMCAFFHREERHSYSGKWSEMESVRSSSTKYIEL